MKEIKPVVVASNLFTKLIIMIISTRFWENKEGDSK